MGQCRRSAESGVGGGVLLKPFLLLDGKTNKNQPFGISLAPPQQGSADTIKI